MPNDDLSEAEFHRYARHLILDEVGDEGQAKLKLARVLASIQVGICLRCFRKNARMSSKPWIWSAWS